MYRQAVRESFLILLVASVLGFSYTAVTEKGVFQEKKKPTSQLRKLASMAPAMISLEEAKSFFDSKRAFFIDARHSFEYNQGHIRGAVNIPVAEFEKKTDILSKIPKDRLIITYCDGVECNSSILTASKLFDAGFTNVKIFFSGWQDWTNSKYPTDASK